MATTQDLGDMKQAMENAGKVRVFRIAKMSS